MNRLVTSIAAGLALGGAVSTGSATAQSAKDVVGTWTLVSNTVEQGGKKVEPFGPDPKGILVLDADGHYALIIVRPDLPKFASHNRATGTPEENKAVVKGSTAYFGKYTVSDSGHRISIHVEGSTFPNWTGTDLKRKVSIAGDQMTQKFSSAVGGNGTAVWKRAK